MDSPFPVYYLIPFLAPIYRPTFRFEVCQQIVRFFFEPTFLALKPLSQFPFIVCHDYRIPFLYLLVFNLCLDFDFEFA